MTAEFDDSWMSAEFKVRLAELRHRGTESAIYWQHRSAVEYSAARRAVEYAAVRRTVDRDWLFEALCHQRIAAACSELARFYSYGEKCSDLVRLHGIDGAYKEELRRRALKYGAPQDSVGDEPAIWAGEKLDQPALRADAVRESQAWSRRIAELAFRILGRSRS
jgi:hypothetical protein